MNEHIRESGQIQPLDPEVHVPDWISQSARAAAPERRRGEGGTAIRVLTRFVANLLFVALTIGLTYFYTNTFTVPVSPALAETDREAIRKLEELKAKDRELLTTYGAVDPVMKTVRLPIERAIELSLKEGFRPPALVPPSAPGKPGAAGSAAAAGKANTLAAAAPASPASAPPLVPGGMTPEQLYRAVCIACHDHDGRGNVVRKAIPAIPDLTDAKWQASRTDADLQNSILNGKGQLMLPMKDKLALAGVDVKNMVAFMRSFQSGKVTLTPASPPAGAFPLAPAPAAGATSPGLPGASGTAGSLALNLSPTPAFGSAAGSSGPAPGSRLPASISALPVATQNSAAANEKIRAGGAVFSVNCIACHGPDGRGTAVRIAMPPIPDFTSADWQKSRQNPQLVISILEGKGTLMPPWRGKVTPQQAQDLVAYVRSFGPAEIAAAAIASMGNSFKQRLQQLRAEFDLLESQASALAGP